MMALDGKSEDHQSSVQFILRGHEPRFEPTSGGGDISQDE